MSEKTRNKKDGRDKGKKNKAMRENEASKVKPAKPGSADPDRVQLRRPVVKPQLDPEASEEQIH